MTTTVNHEIKRLEVRLPRSTEFSRSTIRGFSAGGEHVLTDYRELGWKLSDCLSRLRAEFPNADIVEG